MKKNNTLVMILAAIFCMALGISPVYSQNAVDHYNQRFANLDKGDYNRVTTDYETALRLDPNNALAKNNLAEARKLRGY
jgi:Tfp pilus assembly protein PilF